MPLIATLIADPASGALDGAFVTALRATGFSEPDWLATRAAFDIVLDESKPEEFHSAALRATIGGRPVDLAVQRGEDRRKRALIADMDSTMIDQECIDELAAEAGFGERVAAITARAMNGEIEFEGALRERVALLKGLPVAVIERVLRQRIRVADGARTLVATMRANGAYCALVSGGFTRFTRPIAEEIGFNEHNANRLEERDGILTGTVREHILGRAAKVQTLLRIGLERDIPPRDFIAVGDGANDLDMLALAGTGVALHAKPSVAERAKIRIDHGNLTALLFLQGYRSSDFAR